MKFLIMLSMITFSFNAFSQAAGQGKAVQNVLPKSVQAHDAKGKTAEAPCADPKVDIMKKLEEEKKKQAMAGKGLSLQGAKDAGCSVK